MATTLEKSFGITLLAAGIFGFAVMGLSAYQGGGAISAAVHDRHLYFTNHNVMTEVSWETFLISSITFLVDAVLWIACGIQKFFCNDKRGAILLLLFGGLISLVTISKLISVSRAL